MVDKGLRLAAAVNVPEGGVGLTVMVNIIGVPLQPALFKGVAVIVAVIVLLVLFIAVKEAMSPVPFAASPMPGVLLTQL